MKKREKIILVILAVTAIFGLLQLLPKAVKAAKTDAEIKSQTAEIVDSARKTLTQSELNVGEKYVLDLTDSSTVTDPFLTGLTPAEIRKRTTVFDRIDTPALPAAKYSKESLKYEYSGFFVMEGKQIAIINGNEYTIGEIVEDTNAILDSVGPLAAVLKYKNGPRKISVPFKKQNLQ